MATKFEEIKAKRKEEFAKLRELREARAKALEEKKDDEAKALSGQIDAIMATSKDTKEAYAKEYEVVYGCRPESMRSSFRLLPESLAGFKTTPKAMKCFMNRLARMKNAQIKKLIAFAKENKFSALDDACLNAFCRRRVSPAQKEAKKIAKAIEKDKMKLQEKERKLNALKGKA